MNGLGQSRTAFLIPYALQFFYRSMHKASLVTSLTRVNSTIESFTTETFAFIFTFIFTWQSQRTGSI